MEGKELSKQDSSTGEEEPKSDRGVDTSEMSEWEKRLEGME